MQTLPIIKDIEERLKQALPDFAVELFPEQPAKYRLNHANGAVLIAYHGSDYGEPKATDIAHQQRVIQWRLTVITRSQHNDFGALAALDAIRLSLLGYRPPHCDKLYLNKEQFDGEESGLWQYGVSLYCHTQAVEQVTPKDLPTFRQGVYTNLTTKN